MARHRGFRVIDRHRGSWRFHRAVRPDRDVAGRRELGMTDRELRFAQAQIRMMLRELEVDIQRLRHEQQFYRRMGFGPDLQDMEMQELMERKREYERRLRYIQQRARRRGGASVGLLSWVMLSPLLLVMGIQSLLGRRERAPAQAH